MKLNKKRIDYKTLSNGQTLYIDLFQFNSETPGPIVHIQSSVHGAEIQGNFVIHQLMSFFKENQFKGIVNFIPFANPYASSNKTGPYTQGRYNPSTGENWNRHYVNICKDESNLIGFCNKNLDKDWDSIKKDFKLFLKKELSNLKNRDNSLREENLHAYCLQEISCEADIVLDLHTGPNATLYFYGPEYLKEIAHKLPFPNALIIPNEFAGAMDEANFINWYKLHQQFKSLGRKIPLDFIAYTIELEGEEKASTSKAIDQSNRLIQFLDSQGVTKAKDNVTNEQCQGNLDSFNTYYSPYAGIVDYLVKPGTNVKKGTQLAKFINFSELKLLTDLENLPKYFLAPSDGIVIGHSTTGNIHQGMELFLFLENPAKHSSS
jgi:predicted deacylase